MLDDTSVASFVLTSRSSRKIQRLYQSDLLSVREIARRLAMPRALVGRNLTASGFILRTKTQLSFLRRNRFLPERQLRDLYQRKGQSATQIALQLGWSRQHVINRLRELEISLRSAVDASTIYAKTRFKEGPVTQAYLIGFRIGDLYVKRLNPGGKTIWVECASTRVEQINLFLNLFRPYGRCWVGRPKKSGARGVHALLDESFDFLLPKAKSINPWILKNHGCFGAFLAGYIDAEGHFAVYRNQPVFAVQSYDRQVLFQCAEQLQVLGIPCRPPWIAARPGVLTNLNGYSNRKTVWRFQIGQRQALLQLIRLVKPYLRHAKRRKDMLRVERSCKGSGA